MAATCPSGTVGWATQCFDPNRPISSASKPISRIDRFGASAPYEIIYPRMGFTAEAVVERVKKLLED